MWRVGSVVRSRRASLLLQRSLLARTSRNDRDGAGAFLVQARCLASGENVTGSNNEEADEDPVDILQNIRNSRWAHPPDFDFLTEEDKERGAQQTPLMAAEDKEFAQDDNDEEFDDVDPRKKEDEEYKQRQQEIREELESRTGRVWKDPWEITDEDWMSNETFENLPEFSPDLVSRISQERVKIHPGMVHAATGYIE